MCIRDSLCHYWNFDDERYKCKAGSRALQKFHYLHIRKLKPEPAEAVKDM